MSNNKKQRQIITYPELYEQFIACGIRKGDHIFVHTSLRSLGFVVGGEETVIRVLLDLVGEEGTVMMPAQTWKNLDPEKGVHWLEPREWWQTIRDYWPAYDKKVTPATGMGAVARMFCVWPGVERSDHPARSVAAYGKYARYLTEHHDLSNIFGTDSPVDRLYQIGGHVLLIGVGYDKNTSIHLAETRANFPGKKFTTEHSAILIDGQRQWVAYETQDVDDGDFVSLGQAYDLEANIEIHKVGQADVRYFEQRPFVDWCVGWFEENRE